MKTETNRHEALLTEARRELAAERRKLAEALASGGPECHDDPMLKAVAGMRWRLEALVQEIGRDPRIQPERGDTAVYDGFAVQVVRVDEHEVHLRRARDVKPTIHLAHAVWAVEATRHRRWDADVNAAEIALAEAVRDLLNAAKAAAAAHLDADLPF